jgi:mono/diheme cytochrome c family protein
MRRFLEVSAGILLLVVTASAANAQLRGDAKNGKAVAERWCSSCHLVSSEQSVGLADAPSFRSISERYGSDVRVLENFLADPHPPMPQLSLTREEIRDLLAYIGSLGR